MRTRIAGDFSPARGQLRREIPAVDSTQVYLATPASSESVRGNMEEEEASSRKPAATLASARELHHDQTPFHPDQPHPRSHDSRKACDCASVAAELYSQERFADCVTFASLFFTRVLAAAADDATRGGSVKLPRRPPTSANAFSPVTQTPSPSLVSAVLHAAMCSLMELRQFDSAAELLRVWGCYREAVGCRRRRTEGAATSVAPHARNLLGEGTPEGFDEHRKNQRHSDNSVSGETTEDGDEALWSAVYLIDSLTLSRATGVVEEATEAVEAVAQLVKLHEKEAKRQAPCHVLRPLSLNGEEQGRPSWLSTQGSSGGKATEQQDTARAAPLVDHAVRLVYLVLQHTKDSWDGKVAFIISWLRQQPQLKAGSRTALLSVTAGTAGVSSTLFSGETWCLWRLCEARLLYFLHDGAQRFTNVMKTLSEATVETQQALQAVQKSFPSSRSTPAPSIADRFTVSPLVAAIVRKHASGAKRDAPAATRGSSVPTCVQQHQQRWRLLHDALQLALACFMVNVQESLTRQGAFPQLLPTVKLHLEEFLVLEALLDGEPIPSPSVSGVEAAAVVVPSRRPSLFHVKATVKLIDGLILLVKEQGRFAGAEGGVDAHRALLAAHSQKDTWFDAYEYGLRITRELRARLCKAVVTAPQPADGVGETRSTVPLSSTPVFSSSTAVSSLPSPYAYYTSVTYEQEALLHRAGCHWNGVQSAALLRSALFWWKRSLVCSSPASCLRAQGSKVAMAAPLTGNTAAELKATEEQEEVSEEMVSALYGSEPARCVRLVTVYADCLHRAALGSQTSSKVKGRQPEVLLRVLLGLTQLPRLGGPRSTKETGGPSACVIAAALARLLTDKLMTVATTAVATGTEATTAFARELHQQLTEAEDLCAHVVPVNPLHIPEMHNAFALPEPRTASPQRSSVCAPPPVSCAFPYYLRDLFGASSALPSATVFPAWEARVVAHQVLSDLFAVRAAHARALTHATRRALVHSSIVHLRLALLERRSALGEHHEDVAASHVQLGRRLLGCPSTLAANAQEEAHVAEALACANAALACLEATVKEHGLGKGAEGAHEVLAQMLVYREASSLRAHCIQAMKW